MCFSSFDDKILDEMTEEELERNGFPFYEDDKTVTNQEFIEKAWYACVEHGYISTDYDVLGKSSTRCKLFYENKCNNLKIYKSSVPFLIS
jgi:hypothetical protein